MFKSAGIFAILIVCAAAAPKPGYLAAPATLHAAPLVAAAPAIAVHHSSVPVATSYANTYKVSYKGLAPAPLVAAAPAYAYAAAPAVAHAPATFISHGYAAPLTYAAHAPLVAIH